MLRSSVGVNRSPNRVALIAECPTGDWNRMKKRYLAALGLAGVGAGLYARSKGKAAIRQIDEADLDDLLNRSAHGVISRDGATLAVHSVGPTDGPVVVLAHCWTGSQRTWAPVIRRLVNAGCRVITWDQRGHGDSLAGSKGHSIEGLADDLDSIVEHFDLSQIVLSGHSMGGMTIQAYASLHPKNFHKRTKGVVLVATAGYGLSSASRGLWSAGVGLGAIDVLMNTPVVGESLTRATFGRTAHRSHLVATAKDFARVPGKVRAEFLSAMIEMDLRNGVAEIAIPTTIICGTRDFMTPIKLSRGLNKLIPGSTLVEVPNAGHMLVYETPDLIAEKILDHVVGLSSPRTDHSSSASSA